MITVTTTVNLPAQKVWSFWNEAKHITKWYNASDDWHAPFAQNDLRVGGKFKTTMAAKDGSFQFDFEGVYTHIEEYKKIDITLLDNRKMSVAFEALGTQTKITEMFEPETENPIELQQGGWQAILNNFKKYAENNN